MTPPAPVLKVLPKIFAHADKNVRAEGTQLTHALYQYIGPAIDPWLAELKSVQVKELQEAFEGMEKEGKGKGALKAERLTREHQREVEANANAGVGEDAADAEAAAGRQSQHGFGNRSSCVNRTGSSRSTQPRGTCRYRGQVSIESAGQSHILEMEGA